MANITVGYLEDGTPCTYTTLASAIAAMSADDVLQLYYGSASGVYREVHIFNAGGGVNLPGSIEGMLPNRLVTLQITNTYNSISIPGVASMTRYAKNLTLMQAGPVPTGYTAYCILECNTANGDVLFENIHNLAYLSLRSTSEGSGIFTLRNCVSIGGLYVYRSNCNVYNNTLMRFCSINSYYMSTHIFKNNVASTFIHAAGNGNWSAECSNNASGDATAPGTTPTINLTNSQASFIRSMCGLFDYRIQTDSALIGAGVAYESLATDIDGQTRPNPPSIGASEGLNIVCDPDFPEPGNVLPADTTNGVQGTYAPDFPEVENVRTNDTVNGEAGTYVPDFPERENVLTIDTVNGLAGRWHKALSSSYAEGETFGVDNTSETGTYVGDAEQPDAPTLAAATAGDTQVSVPVTLNESGNAAYLIWRTATGTWSAPSESFKATESGAIVATGLTNGTKYYFAAVSLSSGLYSLPSNIVSATPNSGSALPVEAAVYALLSADTDFTSAASARIYPQLAPKGATRPFVVYTRVTGSHEMHLTNAAGLATVGIQVDIYASTYLAAKALAEIVRLVLSGYSGTVTTADGSLKISSCVLSSDTDGLVNPDAGQEKGIYRVMHEYSITYGEAVNS